MNIKRLFVLIFLLLLMAIVYNQAIIITQNTKLLNKANEANYENDYYVNDVFYNILKYTNSNLSQCDLIDIKLKDLDKKINSTLNKTTLAYLKVDKFNHLFVKRNECNGPSFTIGFNNSTIVFEQEDKNRIPFFFEHFKLENETRIQ